MSRYYAARPDTRVIDPDRGSSTVSAKRAELISTAKAAAREDNRQGLRELDQMTEQLPGLNRLQRDRARVMPRDTSAPLGHPAKQRPLLAAETRAPLSARQLQARSRLSKAVATRLPASTVKTQREVLTQPQTWARVNDALSEGTGDIEELSGADQQRVRRLDRAIQAYEKGNDRGHVVFTNIEMPTAVNHTSLEPFVTRNFQSGDRFHLDRYTMSTHQLDHSDVPDPAGRTAVLELQTRRGLYMGTSTGSNTDHLLPRGMEIEIVGVRQLTTTDRQGTTRTRLAIQAIEVTNEKDES